MAVLSFYIAFRDLCHNSEEYREKRCYLEKDDPCLEIQVIYVEKRQWDKDSAYRDKALRTLVSDPVILHVLLHRLDKDCVPEL